MGRKITVAITIVLTAGLFTGWYLFTRESKFLGTSAFSALPENSAVIIRIHNLKNYTASSIKSPIWKGCSSLPGVSSLYRKLSFADSLINSSSSSDNPLPNNELTIAIQRENNQNQWLSIIELSSLSEKRMLSGLVKNYFSKRGIPNEKSQFGQASLTSYTWPEEGKSQHFYTTFYHGLFLGSTDQKFLEQSLTKLDHPGTTKNLVFERSIKSKAGDIDARFYLNHQKLPLFARQLFSETLLERLKGSASPATWSEIDLTQKSDELILNGFSFTADSLKNHLGIFLRQQPDSFKLAKLFPAQTTFFLSYVINNNTRFFEDYEHLLASRNSLDAYRKSLIETDSLYGLNLQKIVSDHLNSAAAMVFTHPDPTMPEENKYLVLTIKNETQLEESLMPLVIQIPGHRKRDKPKNFTLFKPDNETEFKIYHSAVSDLGKRVLGEVFAEVKTNYYTIFDNNLIMSASSGSLERFLKANLLHETLENNPSYRKFTQGLSDRLNLYAWVSPGRALPYFKDLLNDQRYAKISGQLQSLVKIESLGWQIGNENGMIYNMARLKYNPDLLLNTPSVSWKSHPGTTLIVPPVIGIMSSDQSPDNILVQDKDFNLIHLNSAGQTLWKIKLNGPIIGEIIEQNDFNVQSKQFLFSTGDALHLINEDGKYLSKFPVELASKATNGVAVFDYDKNNECRIFIACENHRVYLYDKEGEIITGWNPPKTEQIVKQPVQFFRVENKDYLIITDTNRAYILDRKGKPALKIKGDITFSNNSFTLQPKSGKNRASLIATDTKGTIISIGFDGSVKKTEVGKFSPAHHFLCTGTNHENTLSYLFLDGETLSAYNSQGNQLLMRKFNHTILNKPQLFTFPDKSFKIGITDTSENKIYLLNDDGTVADGFPLEGSTPFAITFKGGESSKSFNVITGMPEGEIINYIID